MTIELLLIGAVFTLINSILVSSINRTINKKEKLEEEKTDKLSKAFEEMTRRLDVLLKRQDKLVEIVSFIVYEHTKNHGPSDYIQNLLDDVRG